MKKNINLDELLNNALGFIKDKDYDEAMAIYERVLEEDSMHPQALSHLSIIYLMKEKYTQVVDTIKKLLKVIPPIIGDYQNLALAYIALKDYENAINTYKNIIEINPNHAETYKLLGDAQMEVVDYFGAIDSYKKALELEPDKFQSKYDYGNILVICLHHDEALKYLREALKIDPNHIECMNLIGRSLSAICEYEEAKKIYKKLMKLAPDAVLPHIDYASCLAYEGGYDEPVKILKEVLVKKPENRIANTNLGLFHLSNKNFKEGWKYYDERILMRNDKDVTKRHDMLKKFFSIDMNKKELKIDEKIIILIDAGLGDVILGLSMLTEFHKKFKNISAEVDYRLLNLCKRSFPDINFYPVRENRHKLIIDYDLSNFDKGIYWGSLGKYVRQEIEDFPKKETAFLNPDKNKINIIKNKLEPRKDILCGISWKSFAHEGRHKTAMLEDLLPIFKLKGISFLDLQYEDKNDIGHTSLEKEKLFKERNIKIDDYEDIDKREDIDDLTALASNCDIIVTCSNVTAHIAGALGKKTFLFVPFRRGKLWYWHDKIGDSIWYPNIKIYTAESFNSWGNIFQKIADKIQQEL